MLQRKLDALTKPAVSELRSIISRQMEEGVTSASVEIFLDDDGGSPSIWMYWQGSNNRVDRIDQSLFAGRALELCIDLSGLSAVDSRYFEDPDAFPGHRIVAQLASRWFAESWWKAGGWDYVVPVALSVHDYGPAGIILAEGDA